MLNTCEYDLPRILFVKYIAPLKDQAKHLNLEKKITPNLLSDHNNLVMSVFQLEWNWFVLKTTCMTE